MPNPTVVIVTGANRGIGQAICNLILARPSIRPLKLYATSRKGEDLGLSANQGNDCEVAYPRLDISNHDSLASFAAAVKRDGAVDVLINNAGINVEAQYSHENAKKTLDVNYRGTLEMCQTFAPSMSKTGRIVNLSSVGSLTKQYSEAMARRFRDPKATLDDLARIADEYERSVNSHNEEAAGFGPPPRSYSVSKSLMNAFTAILARDNPGLTINCCCPGWIATSMGRLVGSTKVQPPKTPEEGARIPMRLAFEELGGVTGKYWANGSVRSRDAGDVQEW